MSQPNGTFLLCLATARLGAFHFVPLSLHFIPLKNKCKSDMGNLVILVILVIEKKKIGIFVLITTNEAM